MNRIMRLLLSMMVLGLFSTPLQAGEEAINEMLSKYQQQGAVRFSASNVEQLWNKKVQAEDGSQRSCATCHGSDLTAAGKHFKTGKVIEPMALSVNSERYQKTKKIKKWFLRNCKWTWGRECTAQEKGDFLTYLKSQ